MKRAVGVVAARAAGLLLAAALAGTATHVLAVLLLPALGSRDAYGRLAAAAPELTTETLARAWQTGGTTPFGDPPAALAACAFDLSAGPVRLVLAAPSGLPLAMSVHRAGGGAVFAAGDAAALDGVIEALVVTPRQAELLDEGGEVTRGTRVLLPEGRGVATFRALAPRPSLAGAADAAVAAGRCARRG